MQQERLNNKLFECTHRFESKHVGSSIDTLIIYKELRRPEPLLVNVDERYQSITGT